MAEGTQPLPPQDLDAEDYVVGAMMVSGRAIDIVTDTGLVAADFYRVSTGKIFDAVLALYAESVPADPLTVVDKLTERGDLDLAGGADAVREVAAIVPAVSNVEHYAKIVLKKAVLRKMTAVGAEIARLGYDGIGELPDVLDRVETLVFDLAQSRRHGDFVTIQETVREAFDRIHQLNADGREIIGIPSGYRVIDGLTSGFQPGNLIVLAARPSMGKTGLGLGFAANVALRAELPVAIFTMEMSRSEVTQRFLAAEGLIESQNIRNGRLGVDEWSRLTSASAKLDASAILIDDTADLTAMELRSKARKLKLRYPTLGLIVVDYIQLMTSGQRSDNRVQDVSQTSRSLKILAAELQVPVVALSQLSRQVEQRHDRRPMLSDLRESGAIEQDADVVMFIYRDEYYNPEDTDAAGIAEVDIAKHRNGPTGTVNLSFVKRYVRFSDLPRPGAGEAV